MAVAKLLDNKSEFSDDKENNDSSQLTVNKQQEEWDVKKTGNVYLTMARPIDFFLGRHENFLPPRVKCDTPSFQLTAPFFRYSQLTLLVSLAPIGHSLRWRLGFKFFFSFFLFYKKLGKIQGAPPIEVSAKGGTKGVV